MSGWVKTQWSDIKGNAKWDALKWTVSVIRDWWVPLLTTLAAISFWFSHLAVPSRLFIMVPLTCWFVQGIVRIVSMARAHSQMNITFTADDGFSHQQCITVTNHGDERSFTAECRIESSNRPNNYPRGLFKLGWGDGTQLNAMIPRYASERILIANFRDVTASHSLLEMSILKVISGESQVQWWARWQVERDILPYFKLRVAVIAHGAKEPWVRHFLLTPKSPLGPLSLTTVEIEGEG
jgi:hypothetical protein